MIDGSEELPRTYPRKSPGEEHKPSGTLATLYAARPYQPHPNVLHLSFSSGQMRQLAKPRKLSEPLGRRGRPWGLRIGLDRELPYPNHHWVLSR